MDQSGKRPPGRINHTDLFLIVTCLGLFPSLVAAAEEILSDLTYTIVTPENFEPEKTYPAVFALRLGDGGRHMVENALEHYWVYGKPHGYITVSPVAPNGVLFFGDSEQKIPWFVGERAQLRAAC